MPLPSCFNLCNWCKVNMLFVDRKYSLSATRLRLREGDCILPSNDGFFAVDGDEVSDDDEAETAVGEVENKETLRSFSISNPPPPDCCCCCRRFFASACRICSSELPRCYWRITIKHMKSYEKCYIEGNDKASGYSFSHTVLKSSLFSIKHTVSPFDMTVALRLSLDRRAISPVCMTEEKNIRTFNLKHEM